MTLAVGSFRSIASSDSIRSVGSFRSILSLGSIGSILSIGSAGSILSIGSAGSILSIGSAGSILSAGSAGSILSLRSQGKILHVDDVPLAKWRRNRRALGPDRHRAPGTLGSWDSCASGRRRSWPSPSRSSPPAVDQPEIIDEVDGATPTSAPSSTTTTAVVELVDPVDPVVAFDADRFEAALTEMLSEWQAENGAPAVSLSIRFRDVDPVTISLGVTDLVTAEPVSPQDYFRVGSITKPMTAALVLQLIEEGSVELDEPVHTYLPGWLDGYPFADAITIRQLMDHTNGLREYALDPDFYTLTGPRLDTPFEPSEIWSWLAEQEPLFEPGEAYSYETGGFLTLGTIIEGVTGNRAADEMRDRIFDPAGAVDIYLTPQEFPPDPVVRGYGRDLMYFAVTTLIGRPDEQGLMIGEEPVADVLTAPQAALQSAGWTGGGVEAQLDDVAAVMMAMFDGTILSPEQIGVMTEPVFDSGYGLGISTDIVAEEIVYSHGGGVPGFRSQAGYLPDHDVAYAVSSSLIPLPEGAGVGELQARLVPILTSAFAAS